MKKLLFILFFPMCLLGQTIEYGPYLQQVTTNSITICWKTTTETNSKVNFGIGTTNNVVEDNTLTKYHAIKLSSLQANTKYQYNIGTTNNILQQGVDNYFFTQSAEPEAPIRIWAMGDFGDVNYNPNQTAVRDAYYQWHKKTKTDVWLWLGDNAYCCGTEAEYKTQVFDVYKDKFFKNTPFYSATGNHEFLAEANMQSTRKIPYLNIVNNPTKGEMGGVPSGDELYYSFDYANVHFISLDSYGMENGYRLYDKESPQYQWFVKDLVANKKKWTIVFFHHPPYTSRSHNSDGELELVKIRESLVPIFDQFKVDLVLNGHSHIYERSYLIKNHTGYSSSFNSNTHAVQKTNMKYDGTENSCPVINKTDGTIYAVVGSAGRLDIHPIGVLLGQHTTSAYSNIDIGGSLLIDIEKNQLAGKWIAANGKVLDQFTVFKEVNKTTKINLAYGEKTTLTASWKGTHTWSNGIKNKQNVDFQAFTNTTISVKDSLSCLEDIFEITVSTPATLEVSTITGNICNGSNISIPFSVKNTDITKYNYTAEISDKNGNFDKALKLATAKTSPILATIPDSISASNNYKIRVIANSNLFVYTNPQNINISRKASATISGSQDLIFGNEATIIVSLTGSAPFNLTLSDGQKITTDKNTTTFNIAPKVNTIYTANISNSCGNATSNVFNLNVSAQPSLEISPIIGNICNGSNISIPFSVKNTDITKYTYTAEISDKNGNFDKNIKLATSNSSPINATIQDSLSASNNYKIRVIANSNLFAYTNPQNISILRKPTATISGSQDLIFGNEATIIVSLTGSAPFNLTLSDGQKITTDKNVASFVVNPKSTSIYILSVSNACGVGTTSGDAIISVPLSTELTSKGFIVMPNPFKDELKILCEETSIGNNLLIINTLGQIIYRDTIKNINTIINTVNWEKGVYFVKIGDIYAKKIVK